MPTKFLVLGGGFWSLFEGRVEVPILFLWAWGFFPIFEIKFHQIYNPPKMYAVNYKLFWEDLQLQFSAPRQEFSLCSCSCPILPGIILNMHLQPSKIWEVLILCSCSLEVFRIHFSNDWEDSNRERESQ